MERKEKEKKKEEITSGQKEKDGVLCLIVGEGNVMIKGCRRPVLISRPGCYAVCKAAGWQFTLLLYTTHYPLLILFIINIRYHHYDAYRASRVSEHFSAGDGWSETRSGEIVSLG